MKKIVRILDLETGFRNILVHDYLTIDVGKVAEVLHYGLDDFDEFSTAVVEFFEKRS